MGRELLGGKRCQDEPVSSFERGLLSVVIPCYNEVSVLPLLEERLLSSLEGIGMPWEVVFVDDGSRDGSYERLAALTAADARFKVLRLSRNFGHQAAIAAGLSWARGEAVAILDADLQDPPELIATCLAHWRGGDQVVYCQRKERKEGPWKRLLYGTFYRILRASSEVAMPLDAGDFCLMDRRVVDVINAMPEHRVFVRGLRAWAGFRQRALPYERPARATGATKYGFGKLLALAGDGLFSFTLIPLRVATWLGLLFILCSGTWGLFILAWRLLGFSMFGHAAADLPGWTGFVLLLILFGSFQLLLLGVLGEYIGRIYEETKGRPRWVVEAAHGFERRADR
jgi:dolichol-phosphate mannosyltransferase